MEKTYYIYVCTLAGLVVTEGTLAGERVLRISKCSCRLNEDSVESNFFSIIKG